MYLHGFAQNRFELVDDHRPAECSTVGRSIFTEALDGVFLPAERDRPECKIITRSFGM